MKIFLFITVSTLLLSAQDRTVKEYHQPSGRLSGTVECAGNECKAYDIHRHLLGVYNKLTKESRWPDGRLLGKFNALPALVYSVCPLKSKEIHQSPVR